MKMSSRKGGRRNFGSARAGPVDLGTLSRLSTRKSGLKWSINFTSVFTACAYQAIFRHLHLRGRTLEASEGY